MFYRWKGGGEAGIVWRESERGSGDGDYMRFAFARGVPKGPCRRRITFFVVARACVCRPAGARRTARRWLMTLCASARVRAAGAAGLARRRSRATFAAPEVRACADAHRDISQRQAVWRCAGGSQHRHAHQWQLPPTPALGRRRKRDNAMAWQRQGALLEKGKVMSYSARVLFFCRRLESVRLPDAL